MSEIDYWEYRIAARTVPTGVPGADPSEEFQVIEAYYTKDNDLIAWADHLVPIGDSLEDLREELTRMMDAFAYPVLTEEDLPK